MWHSEYKLHLYLEYSPSSTSPKMIEALRTLLGDLNVIGMSLGSELNVERYATGEHFLSYFTFMGCSPDIELEPQPEQNNSKPFCYIDIEVHDKPQFISGKNTKFPPCPHCKNKLTASVKENHCEHCNTAINLMKLNWRKSAFYATYWITIGNIYELEAIPNDALLAALEDKTGSKWKVAYIRHTYN